MMHNASHPGLLVRHDCLEPLGLSVTKAAAFLEITRQTLNNLVNGKAGISPEMAIRLEKAGWSTAEAWMQMQMQYDLWHPRKKAGLFKVKKPAEIRVSS